MKNKYPFLDIGIENIEIEGGETVLLPTGELYPFKGKKHKSGGIDIYSPPNTKIFSEHLKAPKEVVKGVTGKNLKSQSFASLSKKFNPTPYKSILENKLGHHDDLTLRTSELMFNKLNGHQDNIFYAQETFKEEKGMKNDAHALSQKFQPGGTVPPIYPIVHPQEDIDFFNQYDLGFEPDALTDFQIKGIQPQNPDGTFGQTRTYDDFLKFNRGWYDFSNFDRTNSQSVLDFQRKYNQELAKYGNPELVNRFGLKEDGKWGEETSRAVMPSRESQAVPLLKRPINPVQNDLETKLGSIPDIKPRPYEYDDKFPNLEVKKGNENQLDNMGISDALKMGLGLTDLLSLNKRNPYYQGQKVIPALQRFNPQNTLANERAYNLQKENLSQLPASVSNALLAQGQAALQDGVNQVGLANFQGDNDVDNRNTQALVQAFNQNESITNQANARYVQEDNIAQSNLVNTQLNYKNRLFDLYDDMNYRKYSRDLISQLGHNYQLDRQGNVRFIEGSQPNPTLQNPLQNYRTGVGPNNSIDIEQLKAASKADLLRYIQSLTA